MNTPLWIAATVFLVLAAGIHAYIFYLESVAWLSPEDGKGVRMTPEQAQQTRALAFNQGFYNALLAVMVIGGIMCVFTGAEMFGLGLVVAGATAMTVAGLVLVGSDKTKLRPALIQLVPPAIGIVLLCASLLAG